ncbi:MAG TPA: sugar phosphate isomerase/epimerase family protein [Caldilineaceae bacterium]|nr:sugar phosphate isomerase/epimerase family protein [Caldilineaceae bacterium]
MTAVIPAQDSAHPPGQERLPIGLCVFGISYSAGFVGRGTPRAHPNPIGPLAFLELAARLRLCSVEMPIGYITADEDERTLAAFRDRADALGLRLVVAGPAIEVEPFRRCLALAERLGAQTVRCVLSGVLCGDRSPMGGLDGWRRHLAETAEKLRRIAPEAEARGIRIGVENHQDATSEDLVWLCETVGSPAVGVTLDTGNPLAVAEDPVRFAERILPYLVHVHLKDYRMAATPSGYRLFHCPIGAGVGDFPALFRLFATKPGLLAHIEMAALGERHIRILEDDYWAGHSPRPVTELLPVLRLWRTAETEAEWRTPWEMGEDHTLGEWEMARLEESVRLMQGVLGLARPAAAAG